MSAQLLARRDLRLAVVCVVGFALPEPSGDGFSDKLTPVLDSLGSQYDQVQYFATHRVVDYHVWVRSENGTVTRAFGYVGDQGETFWDKGEKTKEEIDLGFNFFADEPPADEGEAYWDREDLSYPSEDDVMSIAAAWAFSPIDIDTMDLPRSVGLVGKVPQEWK